ncbi:hypothetical protein [Kordiimonas aquimaris]|uniref:hypothetical protein n=1 Tax=Kordiimonas aquimaris TaxID=707591 RepID=UPI0021D04148|nr:hypothetical protein [Kordiimonas aquimaris]
MGLSISDIVDLRLERGRNIYEEKGQLLSGVIGMVTSGFFVICYLYKEYFFSQLSKRKRNHLNLAVISGMLTSFLSGGRFASAIALTIIILIKYINSRYGLLTRANDSNIASAKKTKNKYYVVFSRVLVLLSVVYVFSAIFIYKAIGTSGNIGLLLFVLTENLQGAFAPVSHIEFLAENEIFTPIYFVLALMQYYIGHGLYQFDNLINSQYPLNAPYLFQYQFYLQFLALNKLGLSFMPIQEILDELPISGVYLGLSGAFFLDFGPVGAFIVAFVTFTLGSKYWVRYVQRNHFFDLYISILFLTLIIFSPIVGLIGTGVFPSLLSLLPLVPLFTPRRIKQTMSRD